MVGQPHGSSALKAPETPAVGSTEVDPQQQSPLRRGPDLPHKRRRGVAVRVLIWVLVALVVIVAALGAAMFAATESLGNNIKRVSDVFTSLDPAARPVATGQLSFLLVGRDTGVTPAPADTFMLATANQDRTTSSIVAIPGNVLVDMPGNGQQRLDAAQGLGGAALQVSSVEALSGVRVDHYAIIDFGKIGSAVDQLGGVDLTFAQATTIDGVAFAQGANRLDGAQALAYLRQTGLPGGEADRAQRQHELMRGLLERALAVGARNPLGIYNMVGAISGLVSVDDTLTNNDLRGLAVDLRDMRPSQSTFVTVPTSAPAQDGSVTVDEDRSGQLWDAVLADSVATYAEKNPSDVLGG